MLISNYSSKQPTAFQTLKNSLLNNKISHAYLFETNEYEFSNDFIMSFVKDIFCIDIEDNRQKDNIIKQIDNNEYIELKVIETSGLQIKKDEMINLQSNFSNKSITNSKRIYVIKSAEKLNSSSGNTILKFLEEPEENIIAILITPSRYRVINTIQSRCQLISLVNNDNLKGLNTFDKLSKLLYNNQDLSNDEYILDKINNVINFVQYYETKGMDTLLFSNKLFLQYFTNREEVLNAFEMMKLLYLDSLKYKTNSNINVFNDHEEILSLICKNNSLNKIIFKINIIIKCIDNIKFNMNTSLLIDSFIIDMEGYKND